jgi:quercetin dioxygenase-like cupin family protein
MAGSAKQSDDGSGTNMDLKQGGSQPSQKAPGEHFTGTFRLDTLFQATAPGRVGGAYVTFEPCARSDWHTHPLGQTLIVTFGCGLHQRSGGPVEQYPGGREEFAK